MRREREYSPPRYGSRRDDRSSSLDGPMRSYDREDRGKFLGRRERGREMSSDRSPSPRRRRDDGRRDDSLDDRPPGRYSPGDGYYHRRRYPMDHDSPYTRRDRDGRDENFRGARNSSPGEPGDDFRGRFRGDKYGSGSGEQNKHRRYSVVARGVDRSATQDDLRKFFGRCSDWAMVKVLKQLQGVEFLGRRLMLEEAEGEPSTAEEMRRRFQQRRQWRQENEDIAEEGAPLYIDKVAMSGGFQDPPTDAENKNPLAEGRGLGLLEASERMRSSRSETRGAFRHHSRSVK
nr:hypothetical protein TgIb.1230c [Toxoplasma gondii RH]